MAFRRKNGERKRKNRKSKKRLKILCINHSISVQRSQICVSFPSWRLKITADANFTFRLPSAPVCWFFVRSATDWNNDLVRTYAQRRHPWTSSFRLNLVVFQIPCRELTRRKPRLLFRFDGSLLLRFADRQFWALLFQLPPRLTRFEP